MDQETAEKPRGIRRQMLGKDLWWVKALDYVSIGLIIYAVVTLQWFLIFFALLVLGINYFAKDAGVTTDFPGAETFYVDEDKDPSSSSDSDSGSDGGGDGGGK